MHALRNGLCWLTITASAWLGAMFVVLHRPGYERGAGIAALFVIQSLLALAVTNEWLTGRWWRPVALMGAAGLALAGVSAVAKNLTGPDFEGYAVIIGVLLILQALLTAGPLATTPLASSSKVHQLGN
jgi:hypothetical protein